MCAKYAGLCIFFAIMHKEFIGLKNLGEMVSGIWNSGIWYRNSRFTNIGKYATIFKGVGTSDSREI